jgi:arginine exporter protein ArgO
MRSQAKIFMLGAALGVVFGATLLASIAHILLIVLAVAGASAVLHRTRWLMVARPGRGERHLKS